MVSSVHINLANIPAPNLDKWATRCIRWPIALNPIVLGILQNLAYPDIWEGTTEQQSTMTAIIHTLMVDIMTGEHCGEVSGGDDGEETIEKYLPGFEILESEDCDMSGCSIPYGALRWKDGILQYKYCGEWYDVEGTQAEEVITPPPEGWDFDDPSGGLFPCGKAYNLATGLEAVAAYIWDNADNSFPPLFIWNGEGAVGFDLKDTYMAELWALTLAHKGLRDISLQVVPLDRGNVLPEDFIDTLACKLEGYMSSDTFESDGDYIDNAVGTALGSIFPLTSVDSVAAQSWWLLVKAAVGKAQMVKLANGGATDDSKVCDCPEIITTPGPLDPVTGGWYLGELFSAQSTLTDNASAGNISICQTIDKHVYGAFQWCVLSYQNGAALRWFIYGNTGGCANDVNLTWHASTAVYGTQNIHCQMDDAPMSDLYNALEASNHATGLNKFTDTLGPRSKIIDSPVAPAGQVIQSSFGGHMDTGGTATATFYWRLVHNNTDASH